MRYHKCRIFVTVKNPGHSASRKKICGTPEETFQSHKTGTVPGEPGRIGSLP